MQQSSLDVNLEQQQYSNINNYNISNKSNNSNLSISPSFSNDNECKFNCSNKNHLLTSNTNIQSTQNTNYNNNTETGKQIMTAQETEKTADRIIEIGTVMVPEQHEGDKPGRGFLVDESASYESDEYDTAERMQLNPSEDNEWDGDYDDDDEDEYAAGVEDVEADEEIDTTEDDATETSSDKDSSTDEEFPDEVAAQNRNTNSAYETLPEAKGLVQSLAGDENESVKHLPIVLKAKSLANVPSVRIAANGDGDRDRDRVVVEEEEEDMGFDEDDERIAIIVEKQRGVASDNERGGFMNEEGSGAAKNSRYKNNRFSRLDYLEKYRRKQLEYENRGGGSSTDTREGSGNFANDDDDDDDDDSDDDTDDDGDGDNDGNAGADADANDDADRQEGDGYFNSKHTKTSNRYFRKNTNDAIKIISTPLGKVGIVYQQTPTGEDNNQKQDTNGDNKKTSSFTDFDALSPDPESSHRLASSHPKITPVLTPDGKVALLYRGDSENSKYEPIRNLTHKFNNNNKNEFTDNNRATVSGTTLDKDTPDSQSNDDDSADESADESDDDYDLDSDSSSSNSNANNERQSTNSRKNGAANPTDEAQKAAIQPVTDDDDDAGAAAGSAGGSFIIRPTDSVLPMINRPLSEVLGIKKNQFKQIRIKDHPTTRPNANEPGANDPRSLAGISIDRAIDTTTLHFLTKVNLAEYPTSMKTRNFDFDFSRDNTMLDERTRYKEHQYRQQQQSGNADGGSAGGGIVVGVGNNVNSEVGNSNNKLNAIANEEVLAKTEVVNLAILPHFDEELERLQRLREHETRRHYRQRYRPQRPSDEELSGIHCIMQAMMGIAAISTVFGMLGTFFKQRILDQIRLMHW